MLFDDKEGLGEESLQRFLEMLPLQKETFPSNSLAGSTLKSALMQSVVSANAGAGSDCVPGNAGFGLL